MKLFTTVYSGSSHRTIAFSSHQQEPCMVHILLSNQAMISHHIPQNDLKTTPLKYFQTLNLWIKLLLILLKDVQGGLLITNKKKFFIKYVTFYFDHLVREDRLSELMDFYPMSFQNFYLKEKRIVSASHWKSENCMKNLLSKAFL